MGREEFLTQAKISDITVDSEMFARFYFRETSSMQSFVKIKCSQNGQIILSFSDIGKSCPICSFSISQIRLLILYAKIKFSQKKSNLQYSYPLCRKIVYRFLSSIKTCVLVAL